MTGIFGFIITAIAVIAFLLFCCAVWMRIGHPDED